MIKQGFFYLVFSGAKIGPHSKWNLGDCFPNFEKKISNLKKKLFADSQHTHKLHDDNLLLHLISTSFFYGKSIFNS